MNTLVGYDLVPEPKIIDAALRTCRWLDDFASAVCVLEVVKDKAGPHKEIYPYIIQELRPTLEELGISTPEELGLDKASTLVDGLPKDSLVMLLDYIHLPGDADDKILFEHVFLY
uniref:Cytochrome c oxidase subunit 5A, mitochondrial n=2 Tax=Vombatus ursinus TaxID=29139 RepID=A0A4X2KM05_VOMUR